MLTDDILQVSQEVLAAVAANEPVVALESTVIAHGLPRPQNIHTALRLEETVHSSGATPATIAVLKGKLRVGVDDNELKFLASEAGIRKISTRDLSTAVAQLWDGATTVASTAWIAHRAGIRVFATGGIGGVHRGSLPDISADLPALAQTPIIVVCSGAKIVLDLPATREWLETHGIAVVGYECDEMPAFYSRRSDLPVDVRADSPEEIARIFHAHKSLAMSSALLVTVPVAEEFEVPSEQLYDALGQALEEADRTGIAGRELTPFLLRRMAERSEGATLRANIALLENNARVAAQVARALG